MNPVASGRLTTGPDIIARPAHHAAKTSLFSPSVRLDELGSPRFTAHVKRSPLGLIIATSSPPGTLIVVVRAAGFVTRTALRPTRSAYVFNASLTESPS